VVFLINLDIVILHSAIDLCQIAVRHHLWWLIADTNLEASWAPVNELNSTLGLESSDGAVYVIRHNITTVEQTGGHIFSIAGIAFHHLVVRLEARHRDLLNRIGLMRCLRGRDDRSICNQREVNARIWNKVGLELVKINVEGAVKAEGGSDG